mmetsp:Transcript_29910/g.45887  ORF Transcript_29910/g.45887 Transcript_29910/m.45887 type:complete len:83 (-) Transcript_29910:128-376(-)
MMVLPVPPHFKSQNGKHHKYELLIQLPKKRCRSNKTWFAQTRMVAYFNKVCTVQETVIFDYKTMHCVPLPFPNLTNDELNQQ